MSLFDYKVKSINKPVRSLTTRPLLKRTVHCHVLPGIPEKAKIWVWQHAHSPDLMSTSPRRSLLGTRNPSLWQHLLCVPPLDDVAWGMFILTHYGCTKVKRSTKMQPRVPQRREEGHGEFLSHSTQGKNCWYLGGTLQNLHHSCKLAVVPQAETATDMLKNRGNLFYSKTPAGFGACG